MTWLDKVIAEDWGRSSASGLVKAFFLEQRTKRESEGYKKTYDPDAEEFESFAPIYNSEPHIVADAVAQVAHRLLDLEVQMNDDSAGHREGVQRELTLVWFNEFLPSRLVLRRLLDALCRKKLLLCHAAILDLLLWCTIPREEEWNPMEFPLNEIVGAVERYAERSGLGPEERSLVLRLRSYLGGGAEFGDSWRLVERIESLLGNRAEIPLKPGEAWSDQAIADIHSATDVGPSECWAELINHCSAATDSRPSGKWLKRAAEILQRFDRERFAGVLANWFSLTDKPRTQPAIESREWRLICTREVSFSGYLDLRRFQVGGWREEGYLRRLLANAPDPWAFLREIHRHPSVVSKLGELVPMFDLPEHPASDSAAYDQSFCLPHHDILVGLAWCSGLLAGGRLTRALGSMARSMFRKVPCKGPRAARVGNACITALGMISSTDALGQLALLKVRVKFGGAQAAIDKALAKLATHLGVPREDLEEMSVPSYGLTDVGEMITPMGDYDAVLKVVDSRRTEVTWRRSDGKVQKSAPAALKETNADDLKDLTAAKKDIEKMLPAQAERLDSLYLQGKSWTLDVWRERYLDHPLVARVIIPQARGLIVRSEAAG